MNLGKRIAEIRNEQKKSLRSVAREADISVAYLSNIEKGESSPTVDLLQRFADIFRVPLRDLTDSVEEKTFDIPESLQRFIDEYKGKFNELDDTDWQRALVSVRLRGKYPKTSDDWLPIFASIRSALGKKE